MRWWISGLLALSVVAPVSAQSPASDNELYASYCFGVSVVRVGFLQIVGAGTCEPVDNKCLEFRAGARVEHEAEIERRERFGRYLKARGLYSSTDDVGASYWTREAMHQGTKDVSSCLRTSDETACAAIAKCADAARLPF